MGFAPDVIVTSPEGPEIFLVAEAKLALGNGHYLESELKRYMVRNRCPVGLVFTPDRLWVYADRYTSMDTNSIERVGEFSIVGLLPEQVRTGEERGVAFERAVQQWLEELLDKGVREKLPAELLKVVNDLILPAIEEGDVRAAHPRSSLH